MGRCAKETWGKVKGRKQRAKHPFPECLPSGSLLSNGLSSDNLCSDSLYADTDTVVVRDGVE